MVVAMVLTASAVVMVAMFHTKHAFRDLLEHTAGCEEDAILHGQELGEAGPVLWRPLLACDC
jgi:hypothetical protein